MREISKRTKSENERINLLVFIFATLMDAFFVIGYLQDASVGNISWTYAIIVVAVVAVGLLINAVLYIRNHGSVALRHAVMVGYGVLYAVIMYTRSSLSVRLLPTWLRAIYPPNIISFIAIPLLTHPSLYCSYNPL